MTRQEALEVFGLPEQATRDEVARRYDILMRKMKSEGGSVPESERQAVEEAYRLLAGIAWHDPEAEKRLRERDAKPGPIARLLKMDQTKLDNLIHYYRWPVLGIALAVTLVVWILATTVFKPPADFTMLLAGNVYITDQDVLQAEVVSLIPGTENPVISGVFFDDETDSQMLSAVMQKLMVEIGYGENDILVLDRDVFTQYAEQGAFLPLDDRLAEFGTDAAAQETQVLSILPEVLSEGDDGLPHVYGIDVTNSKFLKDAGVLGMDMVAVFGLKGEFPEKGTAVMQALMITE